MKILLSFIALLVLISIASAQATAPKKARTAYKPAPDPAPRELSHDFRVAGRRVVIAIDKVYAYNDAQSFANSAVYGCQDMTLGTMRKS